MNNNLLKGKRGIIFGALDNKSIAWKVALHAHSEGAKFVLTNAPIALRMGSIDQLAEIDPDVQGEDPKFFYSDPAQLEKLLDPDPAPDLYQNKLDQSPPASLQRAESGSLK